MYTTAIIFPPVSFEVLSLIACQKLSPLIRTWEGKPKHRKKKIVVNSQVRRACGGRPLNSNVLLIAKQLTFCLYLILKGLQLPDHHPEENKDVSKQQKQINVLFLGILSQIQALLLGPTLYQIHYLEFGSQA